METIKIVILWLISSWIKLKNKKILGSTNPQWFSNSDNMILSKVS